MTYRLNDFYLNPATRELRRGDDRVALPARAFECLAYLIEHRDRAVGRDELIAAVWGRTEVSDALLNHTVVKIRRSLGDTGNDQRTIRTVPRFGYQWVGEIEVVASTETPSRTKLEPVVIAPELTTPSVTLEPKANQTTRFSRSSIIGIAALGVAVIGITYFLFANRPAQVIAPTANENTNPHEEILVAPALVLPAEVSAPDEWRWLRFGLMDLIANRLRDSALHTMSSESVVGMLKQHGAESGTDLLHDNRLAKVAALRILPRVRLEGNHWTVRLDAFGVQNDVSIEAQAEDAIKAARDAADLLLRKLGRAPNMASAESPSPALEELLQRSGAAMLADQLDQARDMILAAPAELQQQPRLQQRMAQIELRTGNYAGTETRLLALLDKVSAEHDSALRARAALTLAVAYLRQNKLDLADEMYAEAIKLREGKSDPEALGIAYLGRGVVLAQKSHFDEAIGELSRARIELETVGDGQGVASVDVNLGEFHGMRHRPAEALPLLKDAVREFERLGMREGLAHALERQVGIEIEMLDFPAALATTERFWPPESHTNNVRLRWTLICARAEALADTGHRDDAQALIVRVRTESDPKADIVARSRAESLAANIAWRSKDATGAARFAADALTEALRDEEPILYTRTAILRVTALLRDGHADEATAQLQTLQTWVGSDDAGGWRGMYVKLGSAEQARYAGRREAGLELFAAALQRAIQFNVPEDLVAVAVPYLDALVEASQLDTARTVAGRIAAWADRDVRVATAQARLFHALGKDDAARKAEEAAAKLETPPQATPAKTP